MNLGAYFTNPLPAPHQGQSLDRLHLSWRALKAASFCMRSVLGFCIRLQTWSAPVYGDLQRVWGQQCLQKDYESSQPFELRAMQYPHQVLWVYAVHAGSSSCYMLTV